MDIVLHMPASYLRRWWELADQVTNGDLYSLLINALGIGIQTIAAATQVEGVINKSDVDNVIQFKPKYYWDDEVMKNPATGKSN